MNDIKNKCSKCGCSDLVIRFHSKDKIFKILIDLGGSLEYQQSELIELTEKRINDCLFKAKDDLLAFHCRVCQYNWFDVPDDKKKD